jgi:hypothetical protein
MIDGLLIDDWKPLRTDFQSSTNNHQSSIPPESGDALKEAFAQDAEFFAYGQRYLAGEYVVLAG